MTSIFDLKTEVKELSSSNQGTSRMEYQQVPPSRDVTTSNFSNGAIQSSGKILVTDGGAQIDPTFVSVVNCLEEIIPNSS